MSDYPPIAAVDLGSNSFHLVVAREVDGNLQILHKEKQRVYLAEGLDDKNQLEQAAIERGLAVLKQFAVTLQDFPRCNVKVAATYTLRRAKNISTFLALANKIFPFHIEVIAGQEEARLIYQGVANNLHHDGNRLVIDVGGGSTELIIGKHFEHHLLASRNMGCVSFTKQFFNGGTINSKRFLRAQTKAEQELEVIFASYISAGWQSVIGTSGTIKSILSMLQANDPEQQTITLPRLLELKVQFLAAKNISELIISGLTPERQASICGGLAILIAIFKLFSIDEMHYSDYSLREGLLYEMQQKLAHKDIRTNTIENLSERNAIDKEHANRVSQTAKWLFHEFKAPWQLNDSDSLSLLGWAAQLHEIGLTINSSSIHKHSAYIVANSQLPGFTQQQQVLLSCIIRFYRKKIRLDELPSLLTLTQQQVIHLIIILRLAVLLNQKRQIEKIVKFEASANINSIFLKFADKWLTEHTLFKADLQQEQSYLKKVGIALDFA